MAADGLHRQPAGTCQRHIKDLGDQKEKLIDAFVYQKAIDREIYDQQRDKLEEEITLAKLRLGDAQLDEVEAVLNFAEKSSSTLPAFGTKCPWSSGSDSKRFYFQRELS